METEEIVYNCLIESAQMYYESEELPQSEKDLLRIIAKDACLDGAPVQDLKHIAGVINGAIVYACAKLPIDLIH